MTTPKLEYTKNYALFQEHLHNRDINRTKLLEHSMLKFGFDPGFPIRCVKNKSGQAGEATLLITHGHHRFHVAAKLGLSIYYIVSPKDIPLFESESSLRSWSLNDFATARARAGDADIQKVLDYKAETGLPMQSAIALMAGQCGSSNNHNNLIKEGKYKSVETIHAEKVKIIVLSLSSLGIDFASTSLFAGAISKCLFTKEFDVKHFLKKSISHKVFFEKKRTLDEYLNLIEYIYNKQSHKKVPIAFAARNAAAARNPTKK